MLLDWAVRQCTVQHSSNLFLQFTSSQNDRTGACGAKVDVPVLTSAVD